MANRDKHKNDWIEAYKDANKKDAIMPQGEGWKRMCELREFLQLGRDKTRMGYRYQCAGGHQHRFGRRRGGWL